MSHRKSYNTPGHVHFLTFSCWQRRPFLELDDDCQEFASALDVARCSENLDLWAYVIMPEHVHLLIRPRETDYEIARILRRIKETASRRILDRWRKDEAWRLETAKDLTRGRVHYRLWQPGGGFDRNLYQEDVIRRAVLYVEANPLRRGLVSDSLNWKWSSARARARLPNVPIQVDQILWENKSIET